MLTITLHSQTHQEMEMDKMPKIKKGQAVAVDHGGTIYFGTALMDSDDLGYFSIKAATRKNPIVVRADQVQNHEEPKVAAVEQEPLPKREIRKRERVGAVAQVAAAVCIATGCTYTQLKHTFLLTKIGGSIPASAAYCFRQHCNHGEIGRITLMPEALGEFRETISRYDIPGVVMCLFNDGMFFAHSESIETDEKSGVEFVHITEFQKMR